MRKVRTLASEEVTKFKARSAKHIDIKEIVPTTYWSPLQPWSSRIALQTYDVAYEVSDDLEVLAWNKELLLGSGNLKQ